MPWSFALESSGGPGTDSRPRPPSDPDGALSRSAQTRQPATGVAAATVSRAAFFRICCRILMTVSCEYRDSSAPMDRISHDAHGPRVPAVRPSIAGLFVDPNYHLECQMRPTLDRGRHALRRRPHPQRYRQARSPGDRADRSAHAGIHLAACACSSRVSKQCPRSASVTLLSPRVQPRPPPASSTRWHFSGI